MHNPPTEREREKEESSYSSHGDYDARDGPTSKEGRYTAEGRGRTE